jgi:hypothetical protein
MICASASQETDGSMFERYTEKARRVIFFSRYEASRFGSPYIETEHLLLGLLREDKALTSRLLPASASVDSIPKQIEEHTTIREKVSTSVDLPISNEGKRVLAYAAEEADELSDKHIGTEHLLLGLLREKDAYAAHLLNSQGLSLDGARKMLAMRQRTAGAVPEIVQIHGEDWDLIFVQAKLVELRRFAWRRRQWEPLDILVETTGGRISFDMTQKDDPGFRVVAGGWSSEFCSLCHWELSKDGGPEHAVGYSNGREWLCTECYAKFLEASG